jgi:hypothetical protein
MFPTFEPEIGAIKTERYQRTTPGCLPQGCCIAMQMLRRKIETCPHSVPSSTHACKLDGTFIHYLP